MTDAPAVSLPSQSRTAREALWFLIIGGGAAVAFILVSGSMVAAVSSVPDWVVSTACYGLFIGPVYLLHHRFTFASARPHRQALPRYVATQTVAAAFSALASWPVYHVLHLYPLVGATLVVAVASFGSFLAQKFWTFAAPQAD